MRGQRKQYWHHRGAIVSTAALLLLAGCAGSPLGNQVQDSLEADSQLEESPPFATDSPESESATEPTTPTDAAAEDAAPPAGSSATGEDEDATAITNSQVPEPGDREFIGPIWSNESSMASAQGDPEATQSNETDEKTTDAKELTGIAADLQIYIRDLQALDLLPLSASTNAEVEKTASPFSAPITRREYARWLFDSYNEIYAEAASDRLRAGNAADEPAFQDVSTSHPDFEPIQGLAEAGIIPSAFTGNSTAVNFRPDAPLVREDLILWKVPLDTRAALPETTPDAVKELWGFQDVTSTDPLALRAIAADHQLGDFANFSRAFGYTTLFRPDKSVTRAEAAAVLWRFGTQTEGVTAAEVEDRPTQ